MIYLRQDFNLQPASPKSRDAFVELASQEVVPAWEGLGGRLVAAWFNHAEWFSQTNHLIEFESLAAFEDARAKARNDAGFRSLRQRVEALAPERSQQLYEPLGAVPVSRLQQGIDAAADQPVGAYTFAILDVNAGQMETFGKMLGGAAASLPILASWRPLGGNRNQVIDLWAGEIGRQPYRPNSDAMEAFFGPLRAVAPRERMITFYPLPYSPLR